MTDMQNGGDDQYVELEEGEKEVGASKPAEVISPGEDGDEDGGNFANSEVSAAGGVDDADTGGDLGEGVEDFEDDGSEGQPKTERQVDKGLKETFPASDSMPADPGAD